MLLVQERMIKCHCTLHSFLLHPSLYTLEDVCRYNSLDDIPYDRIVEYKSGLDVSSNVARQKLNGWMVPRNLVATAVNKAVLDPVNKTLHPFDILFREDDEDYGTNVVIGFLSSCTDGKRGLGNAKAHASLVRDVCKKYYGFNVKTVVFRFTKCGGMRPYYCEGWEQATSMQRSDSSSSQQLGQESTAGME